MIAPSPFLVERRPDRAASAVTGQKISPGAVAYLREQQLEREKAAASGDNEARASADHRALERVHGRSRFPIPFA